MIDKPIKVSFEITDTYPDGAFRAFLKLLLSDDKFDIYIISNDDSSELIFRIGNNLKLKPNHIIVCNFTDDKLQAIRDNHIDIHLDNLQSFTMFVEETTEAFGILVTANVNKFYLELDFIVSFNRILKRIEDESNQS